MSPAWAGLAADTAATTRRVLICRQAFLPAGWQVTGGTNEMLRFEEFGSTDLDGKPLDLSKRDPSAKQLTVEQAAAQSSASVLAGSDQWKPGAVPVR